MDIKTEDLKISQLRPNINQIEGLPRNPRKISKKKLEQLKKSVHDAPEMLRLRELIAVKHGGEYIVICGNQRLEAAKALGMDTLPVKVLPADTPVEKLREYAIKDNLPFGEDDWEILSTDWDVKELEEWGMDVPEQWKDKEEAVEDDFDDSEVTEAVCQRGDVWQLGRHRLMCGDSTSKEDVAKLMQGEKADLCFTDPPYGMKKECEGVLNDNLNYDDLLEFNKQWIPLSFANLKENGSWYCWGIDEPLMDIYSQILKPMAKRNEITFRNLITWDKKHGQGQNSEGFRMYPIADEKCLFVMVGTQEFPIEYSEIWKPVRDWMIEQESRIGLTRKQLNQVLGVASSGGGMANHYFGKQVGQYSIPTEEMYNKLRDYCAQHGIDAFQRDYKSLRDEYESIKSNEYESIKSEWYKSRSYFDNTHDNMNNVWHFDRTSQEERKEIDHATPKPIALCSRGIKTSSREGEIVLDVFGGSGSTLIACEQLGRTCYMMEIDQHYCDVIIARWEKLTGQKAIKL